MHALACSCSSSASQASLSKVKIILARVGKKFRQSCVKSIDEPSQEYKRGRARRGGRRRGGEAEARTARGVPPATQWVCDERGKAECIGAVQGRSVEERENEQNV